MTHCYCIAGDADFILVVMAADMADYEAFTHRFFFADRKALLRKSPDGRGSPFPGQTYLTASVTGMPSAV